MQVLKTRKQWVPAGPNPDGELKVPLIKKNRPAKHLEYYVARSRTESMAAGVCLQPTDPYVILDIDCDPDKDTEYSSIPQSVYTWLDKHPTYTEYSMSKNGLHIIYKLDARSHELLLAKRPDFSVKTEKISDTHPSPPFTGQFMFAKSFCMITGDLLPDSQEEISTIDLVTLLDFAPNTKDEVERVIEEKLSSSAISARPLSEAMSDLTNALMAVPTQLDYYTTIAYRRLDHNTTPDVREHWLNIGMALKHFASLYQGAERQVFELYDEWSSRDPDTYKGREDVMTTWDSFKHNTDDHAITKDLIFRLRNNLTPSWPVRVLNKQNKMVPAYENTKCLQEILSYHQLTLVGDVFNFDKLHAYCREDVATHLFGANSSAYPRVKAEKKGWVYVELKTDSASAIVTRMQKILEGSCTPLSMYTKDRNCKGLFNEGTSGIEYMQRHQVYDVFKTWVDSKPWQGEDIISKMQDTLVYDKYTEPRILDYYHSVIYKVLLWGVAIHYMEKPQDAPTIPILVGREKIGKTSWPKDLLYTAPFHLSHTKTLINIADKKEFIRSVCGCKIGVIDEFENVSRDARDSKNIVIAATPSIRPHYKNADITVRRYSLLFGTTNSAMTPDSGGEGDRRQARITVQDCLLDDLWVLDHQQLWAQLKHDYFQFMADGNTQPWMLTDEEDAITNEIMGSAAAKSSARLDVPAYFDTSQPFNPDDLLGVRGGLKQREELIKNGLITTVNAAARNINFENQTNHSTAHISRILGDICSEWTDSKLKIRNIMGHKKLIAIENGQIKIGNGLYFVVPPKAKPE